MTRRSNAALRLVDHELAEEPSTQTITFFDLASEHLEDDRTSSPPIPPESEVRVKTSRNAQVHRILPAAVPTFAQDPCFGLQVAEGHLYVGDWFDRHLQLTGRIAQFEARAASLRRRGDRAPVTLALGFLTNVVRVKELLYSLYATSVDHHNAALLARGTSLVRAVQASYAWCEEILTQLESVLRAEEDGETIPAFDLSLRHYAALYSVAYVEPAVDEFAREAFLAAGRRTDHPLAALAEGMATLQLGIRVLGDRIGPRTP